MMNGQTSAIAQNGGRPKMLKGMGCILILAATTLAGICKASEVKHSYEAMQFLQRIICLLQSEIRYARASLFESFLYIGKQMPEPYCSWLSAMSLEMRGREGGTFVQIWNRQIDQKLQTLRLPNRERIRLKRLGTQLGNVDMAMQVKVLDLYLEQLAQTMDEVQEEMKTKVRLCHYLGVISGVLICVLLL